MIKKLYLPILFLLSSPSLAYTNFCYSVPDIATLPNKTIRLEARMQQLNELKARQEKAFDKEKRKLRKIRRNLANSLSSSQLGFDTDDSARKLFLYMQGKESNWDFDNCPLPEPEELPVPAVKKQLTEPKPLPQTTYPFDNQDMVNTFVDDYYLEGVTEEGRINPFLEEEVTKEKKSEEKPNNPKPKNSKPKSEPSEPVENNNTDDKEKEGEEEEGEEEELPPIKFSLVSSFILAKAHASGCAFWQDPAKSPLFFESNGGVLINKFCQEFAYSSKVQTCIENLEDLEEGLEKQNSISRRITEFSDKIFDLEEKQALNKHKTSALDSKTEAQGVCIECEVRERNHLRSLLLLGGGGMLSYYGLREARRAQQAANNLRVEQGFEAENNSNYSLAGASFGWPLISQGLAGLRQQNPYVCNPHFFNNPYIYNPYRY